MNKELSQIIDQNLEETMHLFTPTTNTPPSGEDSNSPPSGEGLGEGETASSTHTSPPRRSRAWEARPENKPFTYRTGQDLNTLLLQAVDEYAAEGWHTTTSAILREWALAGYDLWKDGEIAVPGKAIRTGARRRK